MSETQLRELFSRHADTEEPPLSARFVARSVDAGRGRLRRRRATRAAAGGVATVAALAVAATAIFGGGGTDGRSPVNIPGEQVQAAPQDAVSLLGQIALAAGRQRIDIRDDRFIYEKRQFVTDVPVQGNLDNQVAGMSESWLSVDGSQPGWHTFPDKRGEPYSGAIPPNPRPSLEDPTYKYLTTVTTDPDTLLAQVRAAVAARPGNSKPVANDLADPDQDAFEVIGGILNRTMLPPKLGAALYQAAARIPGVTMIADIADLAGRPGIGVRRASAVRGTSATWVFDRQSYEFLGASSERKTRGPSYAVLTRVVVDRARQAP
jgi:hypothetical protein